MKLFNLRRVACSLGVFSFALTFAAAPAFAQTAPNAGSLLHDYEKVAPTVTPPSTEKPESSGAGEKPGKAGSTMLVKGFAIQAHQFPEDELQKVVADFIGKEQTLADLQQAARAISA